MKRPVTFKCMTCALDSLARHLPRVGHERFIRTTAVSRICTREGSVSEPPRYKLGRLISPCTGSGLFMPRFVPGHPPFPTCALDSLARHFLRVGHERFIRPKAVSRICTREGSVSEPLRYKIGRLISRCTGSGLFMPGFVPGHTPFLTCALDCLAHHFLRVGHKLGWDQ